MATAGRHPVLRRDPSSRVTPCPASAPIRACPGEDGLGDRHQGGATGTYPIAKYQVPEIVFGLGSMSEVGHAVRRLGVRHVLLVTDPGIIEAGWVAEALTHLDEAGLRRTVWHGLTPNPKDFEVAAGVQLYLERGCDGLLAIGGGSCIDAAKGIAVLSSNGGNILGYAGIDNIGRPIPPLVVVPSTSGTGADVSQFAVITDTARKLKATLLSRVLVPNISINDPRLLTTMPDWLAAATGLDALTHGIESYVSKAASFLTDEHALSAIRLVNTYLCRTIDAPHDLEARQAMARSSLEAGLAFTNALLGATHALSHQVGGALDLPHGLVNSILLPHVMRYNEEQDPATFGPVAQALAVPADLAADEAAEAAADRVRGLATSVGIPRGLADIGVQRGDLRGFASTSLDDVCLLTNPRSITEQDAVDIFEAAL